MVLKEDTEEGKCVFVILTALFFVANFESKKMYIDPSFTVTIPEVQDRTPVVEDMGLVTEVSCLHTAYIYIATFMHMATQKKSSNDLRAHGNAFFPLHGHLCTDMFRGAHKI